MKDATQSDVRAGIPGFVRAREVLSLLPPLGRSGGRPLPGRLAARRPPRILLLTSTLGAGHARAAQAVETAVRNRAPGAQIETLDFWSLADPQVTYGTRQTYLRLVHARPDLYDRIYHLDQRTWRRIVESSEAPPAVLGEVLALMPDRSERRAQCAGRGHRLALDRAVFSVLCAALEGRPRGWPRVNKLVRLAAVGWAWGRLTARLEARLAAFQPDAIVITQMNLGALLSSVKKRRNWDSPTLGVLTDFGVHDFWLQPGIDRYCVAHEEIAGLDRDSIDPARVMVSGIPLMPGFRQPPSVHEARAQLQLPAHAAVVLVLGGGLGLGVEAAAERLLACSGDLQLVIMAGRNGSARTSLAGLEKRYGARLRVLGWTERMEIPMRAADLIVGKPGGLTVAEALACGRPLVATRSLGGQEGFNVRFLEAHGVGRLVPEHELVEYVESAVKDRDGLVRTQERAMRLGKRDGADRVAELALALAEAHRTARRTA
jgi:processive 1,2-diacylglycerol beta-glucosyltransferase